MLQRFIRIVFFASKVGVNLLLFIIINNYFKGNLFILTMTAFWLAYSFAYYYEKEKALEDLENVMRKKK